MKYPPTTEIMNTNHPILNCLRQPLLLLFLFLGLVPAVGAASVKVTMWKNLGNVDYTRDGKVVETRTHVEVTRGTMDHTGKVTVTHTFLDDRNFVLGKRPKAHAFLAAKPGVWFVEDYWNPLLPAESPPPVGYNIPRGLQVLSSHEHDYSNWRYDVVGPAAAGTLRFQLEPQDAVCRPDGSFELSVWVVSAPISLAVQWFRVLPSGEQVAQGPYTPMFGSSHNFYGTLAPGEVSRTYLVKVSNGSKIITSKLAKVRRTAGGHEDFVDATEGAAEGGTICGRVWEEITVNDIDNGEPGVPGIEVILLGGGNTPLARATTDANGNYCFRGLPPGSSYKVRWITGEQYHVARPYIGSNREIDCDAEFASSLINAPTHGALSTDSGTVSVTVGQGGGHVDLGLFEKPTLTFLEPSRVVIESDQDQIIEIPFKLSKPLRYTPLTLYFRTFSFPQDGATRLVDYRQENVTSTTVPAGATNGVLRFTIIGDDVSEAPETFFIEPDDLQNSNHIKRTGKSSNHRVSIVDDDVPLPAAGALFKEYRTAFGNRILTGGTSDFSTGAPMFWEMIPPSNPPGKPAFKFGPARGLIAHAVLTAPDARGPRTVSFDWVMSGTQEDIMMVFTQDLNVRYTEANAPTPIAEIRGNTGTRRVSFNVPDGHVINLSIWKGEITNTTIFGVVSNLDLGGPDSPKSEAQPETLALTGLDEIQKPAPKPARALGLPAQNGSGVYAGVVETGQGGADLAGGVSSIAVTSKGQFTTRVNFRGRTVPLRGTFSESGKFSTSVTGRDGSVGTLFLQMQTDVSSGGAEVVGTLSDDVGNTGKILAQKPVGWVPGINPCPFAGRYNLLLPQRAGGAPHLPTGDGFAQIVIGSTGMVTISGILGDGTSFVAASSVTPSGRIPLQTRLYANQGSLSGVLQIRDVPGVSDIDGKLRWVKPANARAIMHKEGFDTSVTALGSFHNPLLRPPLGGLTGTGPWLINVELAGGDFLKVPLPMEVQLSVRGSTAILKEKDPPPGGRTMIFIRGSANLTTGSVAFLYEDKTTRRKAICRGLIFQKQGNFAGFMTGNTAMGSFVSY